MPFVISIIPTIQSTIITGYDATIIFEYEVTIDLLVYCIECSTELQRATPLCTHTHSDTRRPSADLVGTPEPLALPHCQF